MSSEPVPQRAADRPLPTFRGQGWRLGQLLTLLGLTGFAVSQPLLGVAGDAPTVFTFAGVSGWDLVLFALIVALVPPLVLWGLVAVVGLVDRRVADGAFLAICALLAGATVIQWAKTLADVQQGWLLGPAGLIGAAGFVAALVLARPVALWSRFTAVLPALAVVLLLVSSPAGDLLRSRAEAPASAGNATEGDDSPASVVFIMLDELPLESILADDGTIDEVRFPNLAAFAADSTWYRDYTVQANSTVRSIPSILSGKLPSVQRPIWTVQPDNLFSLLAPTHDLQVIESATQLCGFTTCDVDGADRAGRRGVRYVLSQMVQVWRDRVALRAIPMADFGQFADDVRPLEPDQLKTGPNLWAGGHNASAPGAVVDFMATFGDDRSPSLNYLHLMLPHQPWMRYPDGRTFGGWGPIELAVAGVELDDWVRAQLNQIHLFQSMYADRLLGEMMDRLKAAGRYDDSLIVVTADHGVGFGPHNSENLRLVHPETVSSIAYVPLLVKSPGQESGRVDHTNLMGVDVLPTIAAELGMEIPWDVDGFAAGSSEIADRGARSAFWDFGLFGLDAPEIIEFESHEHQPAAANRAVGSVRPDDHSLAALARTIEADGWLGSRVEDLDPSPGAGVTFSAVESLRREGEQAPGRLVGEVDAPAEGGIVLLAVDGEVQSVAPVRDDGRFTLLIPPEVEPHAGMEVDLLEVFDDQVELLEIWD